MGAPGEAPIPFPLPESLPGSKVGRFSIRSKLGKGGMGEVYYAEDTILKRPVALKRVAGTLAGDQQAQRQILKEAQRVSALSSEHIASVHDVVEEKGEVFIVMEYVEGENLRQRLRDPLALEHFFPIATQCAEALVEAHQGGLIHRDIKPENIMVTPAGHVKILDFGLARQVRIADADASTASVDTATMGQVGTPGYMAPEMLRQEPADARADIFSLGVVFYEMLSGRNPFHAENIVLTHDRILHADIPPLRSVVPGCPPGLSRIVSRMLAKKPGERYSASELLADLRAVQQGKRTAGRLRHFLAAAALTVLLVAAAVIAIHYWPKSPKVFAERDWVLITDFDNAGGEPIFDETLREALTISLQQSSYVNVLPRDRIFSALQRMQRADVKRLDEALGREICQRENVRVLLAGSIHRSGEAYQIRVRTLEPVTGRLLFAEEEQFQRKEEIFDRVGALASRVRRDLGESLPRIGKSSQALASVTTQSLEALQLYSRAADELAQNKVDSAEFRLQAALALDPDFAMAHYQLSQVYEILGNRKRETEELESAYQLRNRASERERYALQAALLNVQGLTERSVEVLQVLINLYPDDAEAYANLSIAYVSLARPNEAIAALREVLRLKPYYGNGYASLILCLAYTNANEQALQISAEAEKRGLRTPKVRWAQAMALWGADRVTEARRGLETIEKDRAYGNIARLYLARADIYEGKFASATEQLWEDIRFDVRSETRSPEVIRRYLLARVYLLKDQRKLAIRELKTIEAAGEPRNLQARELLWVGATYVEMGDLAAARRAARRLENLASLAPDPYNRNSSLTMQAELELASGQPAQAIESFQKARAVMDAYWVHAGLARAHASQQDWQAAREEWEKVLASKGEILRDGCPADWILAYLELARVYRAAGDLAQSRNHYRKFLSLWAQADPAVLSAGRAELAQLEKSSLPQ